MKGTLFVVHGTGVRETGHAQLLRTVTDGCHRNGLDDIAVVGCSWGETAGVTLDRFSDTLPAESTRSALEADPSTEEIDAAAWAILIEDPAFELRLAAQAGATQLADIIIGRPRCLAKT
jgi:hypothetical protein